MKDNLFEMLMTLFERTLTQLKAHQSSQSTHEDENGNPVDQMEWLKFPNDMSMRVFTVAEQRKLTKISYQFLLRLQSWEIISREAWEFILSQLLLSDSPYVTLDETKWTVRKTMAAELNAEQMAFLDLILYQQEDQLPLH